MEEKYAFRREESEEIVWVDFATMMQQVGGFITLPDGTEARRCVHLENRTLPRGKREENITGPKMVSDSLGFPEQALAEKEQQRQQWGCAGIEFRDDPEVPGFIQVHAGSRAAMEEYTKRRGLVNRTGSLGGGVRLSQEDLDRAAELVSR